MSVDWACSLLVAVEILLGGQLSAMVLFGPRWLVPSAAIAAAVVAGSTTAAEAAGADQPDDRELRPRAGHSRQKPAGLRPAHVAAGVPPTNGTRQTTYSYT